MVSLVPVIVLITLGCVATHPVVENTAKEKYTKEHITSELQKTDLEPAMLMEYLAQLMGKNPGSVKDADVLCRDTDTVLYSSELENILQSVTSPSGHHFSYIVSNNLSTVKELQALEAYIYFVNHNGDESTNLWVNFSPCKECTHVLIDTYRRSSSKPIIHFAQLLTDEDNPVKSIIKSIECLVRLEHEGFSVRVWNWSTFRDNYLTVQDCKDDVNNAVTTREFMDAYMTVQYVDSFVHELAMNSGSVAGAWCSL